MIAILLTTYNGEKYLREQINSIIHQSFKDWKLYITDDGSIDGTIDIIRCFVKENEKICYVYSPPRKGAKNSFIWLLNKINSDYYMFSDQDDIWLPNKILTAYQRIVELESCVINREKPIVVHSDLIIVNEELNVISNSFATYSNILISDSSFSYYSAYNNVTGCTMMFNRKARELSLNPPRFSKMHDSWIARIVSFNHGIISYIETPQILYRQHSNNTIGAQKDIFVLKKIFILKQIILSNISLYKEIFFISNVGFSSFLINKMNYFFKVHRNT